MKNYNVLYFIFTVLCLGIIWFIGMRPVLFEQSSVSDNSSGITTTTESALTTSTLSTTTTTVFTSYIAESTREVTTITDPLSTKHTITPPYDKWYWIGDSRTVGLSNYFPINNLAKVNCGLCDYKDNADTIYSLKGYNIIINLGVNDLCNIQDYIDTYNNMPEDFISNNTIIIMSVNPCDGSYSYLNSAIENFNEQLSENLDNRYYFIDTYSYLTANGFSTVDGLHYTQKTYTDIYHYAMSTVAEE